MKTTRKSVTKNMKSKKILVFGTFDLLHPGHRYLLRRAARYGTVTVIIARDKTVLQVKQQKPVDNERTRLANVLALPYVHKARFGYTTKDKLKVVREEKPNIIVLGYDQQWFVDELRVWADNAGVRVIVLPAYRPELYKSSIIRNKRSAK
jgi:FAD synthetase